METFDILENSKYLRGVLQLAICLATYLAILLHVARQVAWQVFHLTTLFLATCFALDGVEQRRGLVRLRHWLKLHNVVIKVTVLRIVAKSREDFFIFFFRLCYISKF